MSHCNPPTFLLPFHLISWYIGQQTREHTYKCIIYVYCQLTIREQCHVAAYTTCYISIIETEKAITFHYVWHCRISHTLFWKRTYNSSYSRSSPFILRWQRYMLHAQDSRRNTRATPNVAATIVAGDSEGGERGQVEEYIQQETTHSVRTHPSAEGQS